jgi:hypothetical protein
MQNWSLWPVVVAAGFVTVRSDCTSASNRIYAQGRRFLGAVGAVFPLAVTSENFCFGTDFIATESRDQVDALRYLRGRVPMWFLNWWVKELWS